MLADQQRPGTDRKQFLGRSLAAGAGVIASGLPPAPAPATVVVRMHR
jgi:hypothetical protein